MNKKTKATNRTYPKNNKSETKSAGRMRYFYILLLLLTILSLVLRVSGARRGTTRQFAGGTTARALVFHLEESNLCEDLVVTAAGDAVYSDCGNGTEKQYALDDSEHAQLQAWVTQYSVVNYDHDTPRQAGTSKTQLYLNGRGSRQASEADIQKFVDFAETLDSKILSQS
jgi:hypothetical protein